MSRIEAIGLAGMLGWWAAALSSTIASAWLARRHLRASPPHLDAPFALIPVSVLKPLKGVDEGLEANLESFFRLDYPCFELIFSVAHAADPAAPLVERLMARYPEVPARLITGQVEVGANPKVNNLVRSYEQARFDWVLISDSNIRVEPDYLRRQVAHLDSSVGMVTSVVAGRGAQGPGAELEAVYLNTFYARGMVMAAAFGRPCVIGKSMLFRKSTANRFGGVKALARYLAEDFMAGEAMRKLGLRVVVAHDAVPQHIGRYSVRGFWSRHLRWGRIRKAQSPLAFGLELALGSVLSGLAGALAMERAFGVPAHLALAAHLSAWLACDALALGALRARFTHSVLLAWLLRELLALPLWIHIAAGNTVDWRGQKMVVEPGGLLRPVAKASSA